MQGLLIEGWLPKFAHRYAISPPSKICNPILSKTENISGIRFFNSSYLSDPSQEARIKWFESEQGRDTLLSLESKRYGNANDTMTRPLNKRKIGLKFMRFYLGPYRLIKVLF